MPFEEIKFSSTLSIYKFKMNNFNKYSTVVECEDLIKSQSYVTNDGYGFYINKALKYEDFLKLKANTELQKIMIDSFNNCIELHNSEFNLIKTDTWVNVVRFKEPSQPVYKPNGNLIFHNHVDINTKKNWPLPKYTFVSYIQMQNNLSGDDGVLFLKDVDNRIYSILPEEGDTLIMNGDIEHVPNCAPNSTQDRLVLAGNICFEYSKLKNTLL